jgi:hypothetical protein
MSGRVRWIEPGASVKVEIFQVDLNKLSRALLGRPGVPTRSVQRLLLYRDQDS